MKNNDLNQPLGVALLYNHYDFALYLIKEAQVTLNWFVYPLSYKKALGGQGEESDFEFMVEENENEIQRKLLQIEKQK